MWLVVFAKKRNDDKLINIDSVVTTCMITHRDWWKDPWLWTAEGLFLYVRRITCNKAPLSPRCRISSESGAFYVQPCSVNPRYRTALCGWQHHVPTTTSNISAQHHHPAPLEMLLVGFGVVGVGEFDEGHVVAVDRVVVGAGARDVAAGNQ